MRRFEGKVAFVTGGGGAIGSAAAMRFHAEGARVCVVDRNGNAAAQVADRFGQDGLAVAIDITDPAQVDRAISVCLDRFGALDVLFNNAGVSGIATPVHRMAIEEWDKVLAINLRGAFLVLRAALNAMIDSNTPGVIVNMGSSLAGWDVLAGAAHYTASKHAIVGLTKTAALDAAPYGIRVNAICPGVIASSLGIPAEDAETYQASAARFSKRIPLRRTGLPEDVAAAVAFLASDEARHVTGADWLIDGGQTLQSWANAPEGDAYPTLIKQE